MGASASVIESVTFSDSTITDNEGEIMKWEGIDKETYELLKENYDVVKSENKEVIVEKLNEVRQYQNL